MTKHTGSQDLYSLLEDPEINTAPFCVMFSTRNIQLCQSQHIPLLVSNKINTYTYLKIWYAKGISKPSKVFLMLAVFIISHCSLFRLCLERLFNSAEMFLGLKCFSRTVTITTVRTSITARHTRAKLACWSGICLTSISARKNTGLLQY